MNEKARAEEEGEGKNRGVHPQWGRGHRLAINLKKNQDPDSNKKK